MRKQTKLVAVLSAAALLAIGASMTSFAAQGWAEEDGTWVYYDSSNDRVTEEWKRSGENWYWRMTTARWLLICWLKMTTTTIMLTPTA